MNADGTNPNTVGRVGFARDSLWTNRTGFLFIAKKLFIDIKIFWINMQHPDLPRRVAIGDSFGDTEVKAMNADGTNPNTVGRVGFARDSLWTNRTGFFIKIFNYKKTPLP